MKKLTITTMAILFVSGCDGTLTQMQEPEFKQGCYVSKVQAKVGAYNQEGSGELYKLKCSEKLPENYCYEVENQHTGVKAKVGNCDW